MKYVVIIGDGMADFAIDELDGKTPLMAADKPYMNMMAQNGYCAKVKTIPEGFSPGSDVAAMSIFGYDPALYYTGRAPIEAAGMGIELRDDDVAFRCNLVYLGGRDFSVMADYSSGHITTEEAILLIDRLNDKLTGDTFKFFKGISYRHIMIWKSGHWQMVTTPPHDITGKEIQAYLPTGPGAEEIIALMRQSQTILLNDPVNAERQRIGKLSANSIWLWGQGKKSRLPLFSEKFHLKGATVAAVDLVKGVSRLAGFDAPHVEGATGYLDTDYSAKARKAIELLDNYDIVYVHIEAPDEASHSGNLKEKLRAIERIDTDVLQPILEEIPENTRVILVTDHATPISMKTHYAVPVPFVIYDKSKRQSGCDTGYDERTGGTTVMTGEAMIRLLLEGRK